MFIQKITGTFIYYSKSFDCKMLTALIYISTQQANSDENRMKKVKIFKDYSATHPNAIVTFRVSDIILAVHSNASYFSETKARIRAGVHFSCLTTQKIRPTMGLS